jgi:ectoine hydroxylase-related dioxygenase (phytanoyl-CoA dioxygenase family)
VKVLSPEQRRRFDEEGFLVVENVLDPEREIAPVIAEYNRVLTAIADELVAKGELSSTYSHLPFEERLVQICDESGRNFPSHFDIALPQRGIKYDTPMHHGPAVFDFLTAPRLLDLVEDIVGPEIYSNPVQHIRMKLPPRAVAREGFSGLVSAVPWHQDNGVVLPEADGTDMLTVWAPLTRATADNGCLQVIPGSHRDGLTTHCPSPKGVGIPTKLIALDRSVALEMEPGSVLLIHKQTVHGSLENVTEDEVRISLDLRYHPVGQPTGRPEFPGFVARSQAEPTSVLRDADRWIDSWLETRERLARRDDPTYNRWSADNQACA